MIINYCPYCMENNEEGNTLCSACGKVMNVQNDPHQLPVNTILEGRYLIGRTIGQGGFGITYIGMDLESGQRVAIKEFYPTGVVNRHHTHSLELTVSQGDSKATFTQGREKFINEAKVLSRFDDQPNIVSVKDYFTTNGTAYIVMEYLDGKSLQQLLSAKGKLSFEEAFTMLAPVIRALGKVHEHGLIHRDISPSNIMLLRSGVLKLLDFGTARVMSQQGENSLSIVLKPGFAPEEQYRSHGEQGPWTDVYALCATMYKLITGQTPENALNRMFNDTLVLPSALGAVISPEQEQVLLRGMAVHHSQRIKNMPELYDAMCAVLQQSATASTDTRGTYQSVKQNVNTASDKKPENKGGKKKKRFALIGAGALAAVLLIVLLVSGKGNSQEDVRGTISYGSSPAATEEPVNMEQGTPLLKHIAAGDYHSAAILEDGSVVVAGENNFEQCDVQGWSDVIGITGSVYTTVALKADGTIYISGPSWMERGYENFYDIIDIDDNSDCIVGLRADGTIATNRDSYFDAVRNWSGIVDIAAGIDHVAGLRADGTVIVVPWTVNNDVSALEAESWSDIVAISSGAYHLVGLKADGTVVSTGSFYDTYPVEQWRDIVQISAGTNFTVGLKADGTAVCSNNNYDLSGWRDIVEIDASWLHVVGLRADGTVVAVGDEDYSRTVVDGWSGVCVG